MPSEALQAPVRKNVIVNASVERAFAVFTADFDSWWPRSHHIGSSPMKKAIVEQQLRGRCYTEQEDGTECDWGTVLVWDPPHRLVIAWQVNGAWKYEPELSKSSEVEVRFTPEHDGRTLVALEHRYLDRVGDAANAVRAMLDSPNGWGGTLAAYGDRVRESSI